MSCLVDEVLPDESQKRFDYNRKYHTLTPVVEPSLNNGKEYTRLPWVLPLNELVKKPKIAEQGLFMFGGTDQDEMHSDDLFWITMDIKTNNKAISNKTGEYKGAHTKPEVKMLARKLNPEGRGPVARA